MTGNVFYFAWEVALIEAIQKVIDGTFLVNVASFCTLLGEYFIPAAVMAVIYWCIDKRFGRFVASTVLVGCVSNPMIKNVFVRRRPYFDNPSIKCLNPVEDGYDIYDIAHQGFSFPSGHSTTGVTGYSSLGVYSKKKILWVIGILFPILIGCSRFCLGVHYPTDVLVGWLCGSIVIAIIWLMFRYIKNETIIYVIFMVLGLGGIFYCKTTDYFTCYGLMLGIFTGFIVEQRFVNFDTKCSILRGVLRVVIGLALFEGFLLVSKLPFNKEFLASPTAGAYLVRVCRYAFGGFIVSALYPMSFNKLFVKK